MHYTNLIVERGFYVTSSPYILQFLNSAFMVLSSSQGILYMFLQIFFLGGRLIFGPDVRSLIATVCLIVIPVIVFAAVVPQQLANGYQNQIGGWVASVAIIFTAYVSLRDVLAVSYTQFMPFSVMLWKCVVIPSLGLVNAAYGCRNLVICYTSVLRTKILGIGFYHVKLCHSCFVEDVHCDFYVLKQKCCRACGFVTVA
jgi:hypothetical protein